MVISRRQDWDPDYSNLLCLFCKLCHLLRVSDKIASVDGFTPPRKPVPGASLPSDADMSRTPLALSDGELPVDKTGLGTGVNRCLNALMFRPLQAGTIHGGKPCQSKTVERTGSCAVGRWRRARGCRVRPSIAACRPERFRRRFHWEVGWSDGVRGTSTHFWSILPATAYPRGLAKAVREARHEPGSCFGTAWAAPGELG